MAVISLERDALAASCSHMEQSMQYRKFAEECRRFVGLAKTAEQRKVLQEMEAMWTRLAEEAENRDTKRI
jgi:hypothetical protein